MESLWSRFPASTPPPEFVNSKVLVHFDVPTAAPLKSMKLGVTLMIGLTTVDRYIIVAGES